MFDNMIIGFKHFESKAGKNCYVVEFLSPYSEMQVRYGSVGYQCVSKFIPEYLFEKLTDDCIGKTIKFNYEIDNLGRTSVVDIDIL